MKKSTLNLIIDAVLLLCLAAIAGIGILIKYVLVPGSRRWEIYGRNVNLFFWRLDRHQWGTIHFVIGVIFLVLLVLHVVLHWRLVVGVYRTLIPNRFARRTVALILVCITIILFAFSYFVEPEVVEQGKGQGHGRGQVSCEDRGDTSNCSAACVLSDGWGFSLTNRLRAV